MTAAATDVAELRAESGDAVIGALNCPEQWVAITCAGVCSKLASRLGSRPLYRLVSSKPLRIACRQLVLLDTR